MNPVFSRGLSAAALGLALSVSSTAYSHDRDRASSAVVDTDNGWVRGTVRDTAITFFGIPYAAPPVGELRWRPPQRAASWSGTRDATQFAKHCPQQGSPDQPNASEDCLFLNVYVPRGWDAGGNHWDGDDRHRTRLPVMVWIYGGANANGASEIYDPTPLVETGEVVAVTINYRVGALGFLAHPALDSEGHRSVNYGIMDQQLALRWVQRNIDQFGGDPRNVTIFGESAGGLNVTTHVVSPYSAGLFHRAIIESGAYGLVDTPTLAASQARGIAFGTRIGCMDQTAACLRSKSLAEVLAHQGTVNTAGSAYNQLTQDGRILPEAHRTALAAGRINRVPVMQGANSNEGRGFVPTTLSAAAYEPTLRAFALAGGKDPDQILAVYPLSNYPNPFEGASAALGDLYFACSARQSNQLLSQWVRTYAYEFADPNSSPRGAVHFAEVQYLFRLNIPGVLVGGPESLPPDSQELATAMQDYWTQFAWDSNPNSGDTPRWRRYKTRLDEIHLLVQPTPTVTFDYAIRHKCAFWD